MFFQVKKGDIVDILFPSTSCSKYELELVKFYIRNELALEPRVLMEDSIIFRDEKSQDELPLNNSQERFEQLLQAIKSSDSKILWPIRGGYGSGDILPLLEEVKPIKQNKIFIGYSDLVSLTSFLQDRWNWQILCAPFLRELAQNELTKEAVDDLESLIFAKKQKFSYDLNPLNDFMKNIQDFRIFSQISGGCVSVLNSHFGTRFQMEFDEKILFLEDEGEDGERLDRYFRQIVEIMIESQKFPIAILLGNFLQSNPYGSPKSHNVQRAIERFVRRIDHNALQIPVFQVKNHNLGHSNDMRPLILGCQSEIVRHNEDFKLSYVACVR